MNDPYIKLVCFELTLIIIYIIIKLLYKFINNKIQQRKINNIMCFIQKNKDKNTKQKLNNDINALNNSEEDK